MKTLIPGNMPTTDEEAREYLPDYDGGFQRDAARRLYDARRETGLGIMEALIATLEAASVGLEAGMKTTTDGTTTRTTAAGAEPTPGPYFLQREDNERVDVVLPQGGMSLATILLSDGTGCGSDDERTDEEFNAEMEANARLFAASWDYRAACHTPDGTSRLSSLAYILHRYEALKDRACVKETKIDREARQRAQDLLTALRAATARATGEGGGEGV